MLEFSDTYHFINFKLEAVRIELELIFLRLT